VADIGLARLPVATARAARDLADRWLAHLPRDARGFPVPWLNRWGDDTVATTRIEFDPHVGRQAMFHDDHGPVPDFTAQNMGRQRQSMMAGLCQVCGRPVPWSRRNLVLSGSTVEPIAVPELGGRAVAAITEPWLDDRCAAIATLLCPALIRRSHDDDLHVVPVRRERDVHLVVSVGTMDAARLGEVGTASAAHMAALRAACAGGPVAMWVKVVLLRHRIGFRDDGEAPAEVSAGAPGGAAV
jgi:hypothetical protein